jgi:peroxiredoxin
MAVLFLGFLLLGMLRALGLLKWRLEQLEATMPSRLGRSGLKPGKKAPDFTLRSVAETDVSLHDFAGRRVLLVFTQAVCGPCQQIMPELARLGGGALQVVVVNKGEAEAASRLFQEGQSRFPVLVQDGVDVSRKYEAFATPIAFLIDENGIIIARGIIGNRQHIGYILSGAGASKHGAVHNEPSRPVSTEPETPFVESNFNQEVSHV